MSGVPVSVVITTYNSADIIEETLCNIKNQTLEYYQVIVVDDKSTDGTAEILEKFDKEDNFKIVFNDKNRGAAYSRNLALSLAQGEYLIFLDDDDIYHPDMLEKAYHAAKSRDADIVVFRSYGKNLQTHDTSPMTWSIRDDLLPDTEVFSARDIKNNIFHCFVWWAWDKIIKRKIILESGLRFQEIRTTNDLYFVFSIVLCAQRLSKIDDYLITHVFDRKNSLSNTREQSFLCALIALRGVRDELIKKGVYEHYKAYYFEYCVSFLNWHLITLKDTAFFEMYECIKDFFQEIQLDPSLLAGGYEKEKYKEFSTLSSNEYLIREFHKLSLDRTRGEVELKKTQADFKNTVTSLEHKVASLEASLNEKENIIIKLKNYISHMESSKSWKITKPLRAVNFFVSNSVGRGGRR
ncbi:glycosyltransferase family 2 protein [Acetobacter garciniae]|uniref:Glycosyltransferase family 2 protein n=1 Tax=Acetobacter garciniae TaxID=2817435 RepID=A0A939HM74_9PROT|nr:glycosyltransferase family 2 protein [Acetobacter garciniae]